MAQKVQSDAERDRRIEFVGELFLKSGASTRRLSKAISTSRHGFPISNATVADYIQRYKEYHPSKGEQIDSLIDANKGSQLKDEQVLNRINTVSDLVCKGYFIEDISRLLNESYWVIYYDINIRLKKINEERYEKIKEILDHNSRSHDKSKSE